MSADRSDVAPCYCGDLSWTVTKYGRITHKKDCLARTDPWHQGDPNVSAAKPLESTVETARRIMGEIDTYGDPRLYALADEYLRLRVVVDCLLPANGCTTVEQALTTFGGPVA